MHCVASRGFTSSALGSGALIPLLFLLPQPAACTAAGCSVCLRLQSGIPMLYRADNPSMSLIPGLPRVSVFPSLSLSCVRQLPCPAADGDGAARAHPAAVLPERPRVLVLVALRWPRSCSRLVGRAGLARHSTPSLLQ